ncbi:MAG: glycosyltransferase, partial [Flavipsychrobacter sp.]
MKKLVILTQYFSPEMGAPQSRLLETANGLISLGWEVKVITAMPNYPTGKIFKDFKGKLSAKDKVGNIDVWRYWLYASNSKKSLPRIISMLSFSFTSFMAIFKLRKLKPDYVFTESPPLTLGLTGLMLARFTGARHIMNVSDLWPLSAYELGAISKGFTYNQLEKLEHYL